MAPTSRWCANRRYSEERVALEEACGLRPLADGERDPLAPEPRGEDGPGDTSDHPDPVALAPEAEEEEDGDDDVDDDPLKKLDDDDFDPLGAAGGSGRAASPDPLGSDVAREVPEPGSGEDGDCRKFGYGGSAASYTPGYERKANWQDWRGRRNKLLNVRSFLDADALSPEDRETLSVVTVNMNFQVATAMAKDEDKEVSASEQRLRALEDAIVSRAGEGGRGRDRRRTVGGTAMSAAAIRKQALNDQQEMVERLRLLSNDLSASWSKNQRVTAVKIAEKTADLLEKQVQHMDFLDSGSTSLDDGLMITSLVFYPAIYVFACEILDTLGDLVWERILRKCQYEDNGAFVRALPRVFTAEDVREEAKYTCRNWFLKIAGNRSLVGRIYLEASISRCHHFLIGSTHQEELHDRVFARLARMCRGIAHPITSTFARAYVARRGSSLLPDSSPRQFLDDLLADAVRTFHSCAADEKNQNARGLHLLRILEPCIGMVVEEHGKGLLTWRCPRGARNDRLKRALRVAAGSGAPSGLCVLRHFLKNLPRDFAVEFASQLTQLICAAPQEDGEGGPLVKLYVEAQADCFAQMGSFLSAGGDEVRSLSGEQRRQVLNATWRVALKYSSLDHFLRVASSFAGFVTSNFGDREVSVFLQSVLRHLRDHRDSSGSPCSDHHASLVRGIVLGLFAHYSQEHGDLGPLFAQGALVPISDLAFETPERRLDFAEALLALLFKPNGRGAGSAPQLAVSDPLAQQFLLDHCQVVSDATSGDINASHTRLRRVGALVSALILRCDFGGSHEQLLGFLSTCRRSFHKLAQVQELCVHLACQAAAKILARSCGGDPRGHTAATLDAARACVAFCHVTLPSLQQAQPKLNLMLQAASVALMNGLVSQSESLVRGAVALAREEAEGAERDGFLRQCASLCLLLPGHPQRGPLYVAKDLEEACAQESDKISLLPMVCAFAQESLPYHCRGLDSNDVLYAGDEDYHRELQETGGRVIAGAVQGLLDGGGAAEEETLLAIDTVLSTCLCSQVLQSKLRSLLDRATGGRRSPLAERLAERLAAGAV